eukprot:15347239-Ditylum_brightwellii.AAC.2
MADEENFQGEVQLITRHTPPALISNATMPHIMKLYPQIGTSGISPKVVHGARDPNVYLFNYPDSIILPIFEEMKTGKAVGPFANIIDTLYNAAIEQQTLLHTTTNVQISWQYLRLFA